MLSFFKFEENKTTLGRETIAGFTTFAAMAYILAVNPMILSNTGMDTQAVIMATAVAAAIGCFLMSFMTNYPIALAPGMGTNAYFAFVVVTRPPRPVQRGDTIVRRTVQPSVSDLHA